VDVALPRDALIELVPQGDLLRGIVRRRLDLWQIKVSDNIAKRSQMRFSNPMSWTAAMRIYLARLDFARHKLKPRRPDSSWCTSETTI